MLDYSSLMDQKRSIKDFLLPKRRALYDKTEFRSGKELAAGGSYGVVPISTEILSDIKTPIAVLRILKNISGHCYLLESVADREKWGRYTFLGFDPRLELTCQDGRMKVGMLSFESCDPGSTSGRYWNSTGAPCFDYLPSFTGGWWGISPMTI